MERRCREGHNNISCFLNSIRRSFMIFLSLLICSGGQTLKQ